MKRSSSIIPKILIILTISTVIVGVFILFKNWKTTPKEITQDTAGLNSLMPSFLDATEDFWVNAGQKFKMSDLLCPEIIIPDPKIGDRFLSCNPAFWECYWSKGINKNPVIQVEYGGQAFHLRASLQENGKYGRLVTQSSLKEGKAPSWAYQVKLTVDEFPNHPIYLALLNSCKDHYLPERVYAYGVTQTSRAQDVFLWDNFGRELYLDRFPVSNREVNEWVSLDSNYKHLAKTDVSQLAFAATHLNFEEQKRYCAYFGARLMEPHLFDAASMLPSGDEKFPEVIAPASTPWERDRSRTFLSVDDKPKVEDCKKAAVKGCEIYPYNTNSSTWMGLGDSLGFYPEAFRPVYDRFNVKFSSIFFEPTSPWNSLGKRGIWSGEGHKAQDFSTGSLEENPFLNMDSVPVGFRCYKEVRR